MGKGLITTFVIRREKYNNHWGSFDPIAVKAKKWNDT